MGLFVELFLFPSVRASTKAAELRPSACEGVTGALKGKTVETLLMLFFFRLGFRQGQNQTCVVQRCEGAH